MASPTGHWLARMKLGVSLQDRERSVLAQRRHEGPVLIQRPLYPEGPSICHLVLLHPPSGIAGGDDIEIDLQVGADAHATVTTPGATRWYKANGRKARQTMRLSVAAGAKLDWLPLESIFFEEADAINRTEIDLHPDARAIGWEISQLGSITNPNHWDCGRAHTETTLRIGGKLLWVEQGTLGATDPIRTSVTGLDHLPVHASLWCFGGTLDPTRLETLTDRMPWGDELRAGMTAMHYDGKKTLYLVRATGLHAEDVRNLLIETWMVLRQNVLGVAARPLRLWRT